MQPARSSHKARALKAQSTGSPLAEKPLALDGTRARVVAALRRCHQARARKAARSGPASCLCWTPMCCCTTRCVCSAFEEHDIYLPMIVLEELDGHKKGMTEVARNARQTSRTLDALAGPGRRRHDTGLPLDATGHREAGHAVFSDRATGLHPAHQPAARQGRQPDSGRGSALREQAKAARWCMVSKDINMRVKARALGLAHDDYQNDKTLEDGDLLYSGALALPHDFWATPWQNRGKLATAAATPSTASAGPWCPAADQPVCVL
jgi:PhoH-like ATPase